MTFLESSFPAGNQHWALIVNTSRLEGSLSAINNEGKVLKKITWDKSKRHTEVLLEYFKKIIHDHSKENLKKIYFVQGPGSFTGLRVSAAFVKSIAFAQKNIPIVCVSSFLEDAQNIILENPNLTEFTVLIPSIGKKLFSSNFKYENNTWTENIDMTGSYERGSTLINHFSSHRLVTQNYPDVRLVKQQDFSLEKALLNKTKILYYFQNKTYLDLYPLYLRQSEAEEKFRYDKAKLQST